MFIFLLSFRSTCKYQTSTVFEAVDTEFAGHELSKSPVCGVWCSSCLCRAGTLGSPKQQVLWVLWTCFGVGLLGCIAASKGEMEGVRGWGHGRREGRRYLCVTSWPHVPWGNLLYVLHTRWMPHAEQDVFVKKGKKIANTWWELSCRDLLPATHLGLLNSWAFKYSCTTINFRGKIVLTASFLNVS